MAKKSARNSNDYRKLQNMLKDLKKLKQELLPDEKDKAQAAEMEKFDDFQRKKHELNTLLVDIRTDVERLNEMRKKLGEDGRDNMTIRLSSENNDRLRRAADLFTALKQIQEKDEKKAKKKKNISEKDMADRRDMVRLIGQDIMQLTQDNSRIKLANGSPEDLEMEERVNRRKQEKEDKIREARAARKGKKGKRGKGNDIDEDEFKDVGPKSEQEQAFEAQVAINREAQDKILEEISRGLSDLHELATEANKSLVIQAAMLTQVDEKMDNTIASFKVANKRLKDILEESGGMSRWCPMIICAIFLLGLVGYMFNIIG